MAFNKFTDCTAKAPKGDWNYVFDLIKKISPVTMNSAVLSQYDSSQYDPADIFAEAVILPENYGYAWLLEGKFIKSTHDKIILEDLVLFYFAIEGGHVQQFPTKGEINQAGVRIALGVYPKAYKQVKKFKANLNYRYLVVGVKLSEFHKRYEQMIKQTSSKLKYSLSIETDEPCWHFFPLKNKLKNICNDIIDSRSSILPTLRYSFLQAKFLELLCETLNYIFNIDHIPSERIDLTDKDLDKIRSAKNIIDAYSQTKPTLDSLAKELIISRKKLAYGFKAYYGIGVNEYYNQERLENARRELQKGQLNMLDIIEKSGYQSQAAFSRAYKHYFGHTPKVDKAT